MFDSASFITAVIACLPIVSGIALSEDKPLPYPVVNTGVTWTGPAFPGDTTTDKIVTITGTFEYIHDELLKKNPRWDEDFPPNISALERLEEIGFSDAKLGKREDIKLCNGWRRAHGKRILQGVNYLYSLEEQKIKCVAAGGPGTCNRVSCSWESAIYLCNDNPGWIFYGCKGVGNAALILFDVCGNSDPDGYFSGQYFTPFNSNMLVKWADC